MKNFTPDERFLFILMCVLIMIAVIGTIHSSRRSIPMKPDMSESQSLHGMGSGELLAEAGPFRSMTKALSDVDPPKPRGQVRALQTYYQRRAFLGAPPMIPHEISSEMKEKGNSCLSCHEQGGYAEKFDAHAPITPHPELIQCRQCHVPQGGARSVLHEALPFIPPQIHRAVLPHTPPAIPHRIHMRENCLACHGGVAAIKEIQTSHAERINCRQCHVLQQDTQEWVRSAQLEQHE